MTPAKLDTNDVYSNQHLEADVAVAIASYSPSKMSRRLWEPVAEFTRSAIRDLAPATPLDATRDMYAVARLASWTLTVAAEQLSKDVVLSQAHIVDFSRRGLPDVAEARRTHLRRHLLRIARELQNPTRPLRVRKTASYSNWQPYTPKELVRFRNLATARSTPHRNHNWGALLSVGAGFGLRCSEAMNARVQDIQRTESGLSLTVSGPRSRMVPCHAPWETWVTAAIDALEPSDFIIQVDTLGRPPRPGHWVNTFLNEAAGIHEHFTLERLRATWVVGALNRGVPLPTLLNAYGSPNLDALQRFLPFVDTTSPSNATSLRGVES